MAARPHPTDALSLTLPDWRQALKRVRRWRPPRPKDWFWLMWFCVNLASIAWAIIDDPKSMIPALLLNGPNCLVAWRWAWKGPPKVVPWHLPGDEDKKRPPTRLDLAAFVWVSFYLCITAVAILLNAAGVS